MYRSKMPLQILKLVRKLNFNGFNYLAVGFLISLGAKLRLRKDLFEVATEARLAMEKFLCVLPHEDILI